MKTKLLLVWFLTSLFSLSGFADVEVYHEKSNFWYSYSKFNHNNILNFFTDVVFSFDRITESKIEIELYPQLIPSDLSSVTIVLKNDYSIYEDDPNQYSNENNTVVQVWIDRKWEGFLDMLFGGDGYQYGDSKTINNMIELSKSDIASIEFTSNDEKVTKVSFTYPTAGMFREMFQKLATATQSDKVYGEKAKAFFAPYLKEFPLSGSSKTTTTISSNSSSKSTTSKTTANNSNASKSNPSKSTNAKSTGTTQSKNLVDETLRMQLQKPLGNISSDIYFSYPKASAELKRRFGENCKAEYDKGGWIMVYNTSWLNLGGYAASDFCLRINNDHSEWSYIFPHQKTLSGAQNFCNSLASKIKALGIELINMPTNSFPIYYKGNYEGMKITLTASKSSDEYYISLDITHPKEVSKSDLNPVVTVAELFERPLGAPKGKNPVHWFVEKGFAGKVDADMRSVTDTYSAGSNNHLHIHLPLQGSAIYKGLNSYDYNLTMVNRSAGHSGLDFYTIEFAGELKDGVYSWNVKSKQEKQEMKYLWDQLIRELMMQGHKLVKANKKTSGFSGWNPQEGYLENDGEITRRYILTKKNHIVITEQKPYKSKIN